MINAVSEFRLKKKELDLVRTTKVIGVNEMNSEKAVTK